MNKSIILIILFFLTLILHHDTSAKCTGSPNCRTCTNCSRCQYCSQQGGSCGACSGSSQPVRHQQRNYSNSSSNGFYNSNGSHSRKKIRHTEEVADTSVQQVEPRSYSGSYSDSIEVKDDGVNGWQVAFFLLLGIIIYRWFIKKPTT